MIRTRLYRSGNLAGENFDATTVSECLAEPDTVVWMDLAAPDAAEMATLAEEFRLNPLAVEDALAGHQRPKLDRYDDHVFISLYGVGVTDGAGNLRTSEIGVFASPRYLITVRREAGFDIDEVVSRWDTSADLAKYGVGFLLHGLLDVVVDGHFQAVQALDDRVEQVEDLLFDERASITRRVQRESYELRKALVTLRRVVVPTREVVNSLMRRDLHIVDEGIAPYYQDVYDHVLRATDWTDSLRDLVSSLRDTSLAVQGNHLNEIMKKVTSWAAIIAVPTAITGYYGMNVRIFPVAGSLAGGIVAVLLMAGLSVLLYFQFRRRDWL